MTRLVFLTFPAVAALLLAAPTYSQQVEISDAVPEANPARPTVSTPTTLELRVMTVT